MRKIITKKSRVTVKQSRKRVARRVVYKIKPHDSGRCLTGDLDSISEALAVAEGEGFK
jgi:hypothetical protein